MIADLDRQNSCVRSDTNMVTDFRCPPKSWIARGAAIPKKIVNEHGTVRDKAVVTDGDEITDESVRLNAASFTNSCSSLDLHERSNKGVVSDLAPIQVRWLDNDHVVTEPNIYQTNTPQFYLIHTAMASG
jgi:hypothetical protein